MFIRCKEIKINVSLSFFKIDFLQVKTNALKYELCQNEQF